MSETVALARARSNPGRLVAPFAFDPVQIMLWQTVEGQDLLQIHTSDAGQARHNFEIVLSEQALAAIVSDLGTIFDHGIKGEWVLGTWPNKITFTFEGVSDSGPLPLVGSVTKTGSNAFLTMRPESFENLYESLRTLMSNNRIERTRER